MSSGLELVSTFFSKTLLLSVSTIFSALFRGVSSFDFRASGKRDL